MYVMNPTVLVGPNLEFLASKAGVLTMTPQKHDMHFQIWNFSFPVKPGWQQGRAKPSPGFAETPNPDVQLTRFEGMSRMPETVTDELYENSNKRKIGIGFPGFLTEAQYRKSRIDSDIRHQISEMEDHRWGFVRWCRLWIPSGTSLTKS